MSVKKNIVISFLVILIFASAAMSDDIGFVSIKNRFQTEVVSQILPYAYTRFENKFLVSFDESQKSILEKAGIEFEIIAADINVSEYSLVIPPDKPMENLLQLDKLGNFVLLNNNMYLTNLARSTSMATAEQSGYTFITLDDNKVKFSFIPLSISGLVQALDYPTDSIADLVSLDSITAYNKKLEGFYTRYIWSDSIDVARDWIVQKLTDWGYTDITTPTFLWGGGTHYNVMAVKLGYAEPDKVIVVGGHYDSITYGQPLGPMVYAPGSDDNGSGTTVTLELARILADVPLRKTVIFMPFSAEEVGLIGSKAAAQTFLEDSTDLEVMFNYDMVGYTNDSYWDINLMSGSVDGYKQVSIDAAKRVTSLIPVSAGLSGSSDHWSFYERGFNICYAEEGDFNNAGWHTELDLTSRMNFPYLTEVTKMAAASIGVVGNSAYPTVIEPIVDVGDGQSLQINWSDCNPNYDYILYYGTTADSYTDSIVIPVGDCSYVVNGLTEGQRYYFSMSGTIPDGYPAVYAVVENGVPYSIPRPPMNMNANPELNSIRLTWQKNKEADISHYRVYRNDGTMQVLYADNISDTFFVDTDVVSQKEYSYHITAVDFDSYESNFSNISSSYAATFDGGILTVDETSPGGAFPVQDEKKVYYDSIFNSQPYQLYEMNAVTDQLKISFIGRFSSIFYFDDDYSSKLLRYNETPISWYTSFDNNMMLSGFRTLSYTLASPIPTDNYFYEEFGIVSYEENDPFDFVGAVGENGFPSVQIDPANPLGNLPYILTLETRAGAKVIYRYDSATDDPLVEGKPCGIMYETAHGKRVFLAFPLYFLDAESAQNIISHVASLFGETVSHLPGDLDNSGSIDIADIVFMVDYMFKTNRPPLDINTVDVNGSCFIDVSDLVYFIDYLYGVPNGPAPLSGCVR